MKDYALMTGMGMLVEELGRVGRGDEREAWKHDTKHMHTI